MATLDVLIQDDVAEQLFMNVAKDIDSPLSNRRVVVVIQNKSSDSLINSQVYTKRGKAISVPSSKVGIRPGHMLCWGFNKTVGSLYGTVGVLTYDMEKQNRQLCIFFCNPYKGRNRFCLKWSEGYPKNACEAMCRKIDENYAKDTEVKYGSSVYVIGETNGVSGHVVGTDPAKLTITVSDSE